MNLFFDVNAEFKSLPNIITDIINDPKKLKAVAKASYHHALGFDKMVIKENTETGDKLALHFWWPEALEGDDNIHPHRWDFESLVVIGEIKVEKFEHHSKGEIYYEYTYFSPLKNEHYKLTPCGTNRAILTEEIHLKSGESYSHKYSQLHRVIRKNSFVVTLFTQSPPIVDFTKILSRLPIKDSLQHISATRMREDYVKNSLLILYKKCFL